MNIFGSYSGFYIQFFRKLQEIRVGNDYRDIYNESYYFIYRWGIDVKKG